MRLSTAKESLIQGLQIAARGVSPRSPMAVLAGIYFDCRGGQLMLRSTDLDFSVQCLVPAQVLEEGSTVIPAKYITDFTRLLPDGRMEITVDEVTNIASITYGNSEFNINCYHPADFPEQSLPVLEQSLTLSSDRFRQAVRQVIFAVSSQDSRPVFTGVLLEIRPDSLTMVATDTFRLAVKRLALGENEEAGAVKQPAEGDAAAAGPPGENAGPPGAGLAELLEESDPLAEIIVPARTLQEASRIAASAEKISLSYSATHVAFSTGDITISSRLIKGKFPPFRQIIPLRQPTVVRLNTAALLSAAERCSLLAVDTNPAVGFIMNQDSVTVNIKSETGWIREELPAELSGPPLQTYFNVKYLSDMLKAVPGENIALHFEDPVSPVLVLADQAEGLDFLSILVPAYPKNQS
ncbi:MAG: DNA polymerase III subunit beta [Desulfurispora sp.]|uniref:DNA polymerase III subunit beta n=1 Tax=Desulfurispora sp. TaxID=3014275 RepID=UPI0040492764